MKKGWGSNQKGFSLVELLVVVAIIGILVAIAVPNLLDAIDRSKQRATVAEMRLWAISLQEYYAQLSHYPPPGGAPFQVNQAFQDLLVPFTINTLDLEDGWKFRYWYESDLDASYTVRSCGKDGICGLGVTPTTWFNYKLDIVIADGIFVNAPS
jgi:prepilin-type N-terminal cleavage/methylation domain-containing protein